MIQRGRTDVHSEHVVVYLISRCCREERANLHVHLAMSLWIARPHFDLYDLLPPCRLDCYIYTLALHLKEEELIRWTDDPLIDHLFAHSPQSLPTMDIEITSYRKHPPTIE